MDRQHFGFGLEEVDICFLDDLEQGRIRIRRPTRIAVSVRHLVASHGERLLYRPFEMMLGGLDRRTLRGIDFDIAVAHLDGSEVGGGFYETRHVVTHGDHTVRTFAERHDKAIRFVRRDAGFRHIGRLELKTHVFLDFTEDTFHLRYVVIPLDADLLFVCHRDDKHRFGFAGDCIAEVAAVDRCQLDLGLRPDTG